MDFPDLGAAVGPPKRDKIPPRKKSSAAPERKPKSALQSLLEGKSGAMNGGAGAAGDYAVEKEAKGSAAPAEAVEVLAEIGPPPKPVAEPDAAAHEEATAAIQTRIDEGEKRVTEITEEIEKLKGKRGEHKEGIQGIRGELRAHRDKIRDATKLREDLSDQIKTAADEMRRQETKTNQMAKEFSSTDASVIDKKIAEIQGKLEAGGLPFKAEKELVQEIKVLTGDKEKLKGYEDELQDLATKKKAHDDAVDKRKAKTDEIAALREEDKVLSDRLDALVTGAGDTKDANPNVQIQVLMDEKNRKIDAVRAERQALKDATIFYKIKAAEFKEYTQAKQGYERKVERIKYQQRKAEQALRNAQWNETKEVREAERKQRMHRSEARMAAVAAGYQVFVGGLSNRCSEDELSDYFASMGDVTDVTIPFDREANTPKGFGFVVFAEEAIAQQAIDTCNGQSVPGLSHKALSLKMAEKSRIQIEWEEKNPPDSRPAVEPRSRRLRDAGLEHDGTGRPGAMNGKATVHGDAEALPKRVKDGKKAVEPQVIVANIDTTDVPQAPGKWASLLKGSAAPASKAQAAAPPAPPAAAPAPAPAPAPVPTNQPAAAEPPSEATPAAAVQAAASTAPLEETAEEKIKRLEAEVAQLKAQQQPKKRGWGPVIEPT